VNATNSKHCLKGHVSLQTNDQYLGCKQKLRHAVNDKMGIEPEEILPGL
jgi:hypothetical protein